MHVIADEANFTITMEPEKRLLRISIRGYWDETIVNAYDDKIREAGALMVSAGCPRNRILTLVDARGANVQSQELLEEYRKRFNQAYRQPERSATVVSSVLFKLQVERVALPNQRIFQDLDGALEWLLTDAADMDTVLS